MENNMGFPLILTYFESPEAGIFATSLLWVSRAGESPAVICDFASTVAFEGAHLREEEIAS